MRFVKFSYGLSVILVFIILNNKAYYYGIGNSLFFEEFPNFVRPRFSGSDKGNRGFYLVEKETTTHVVDNILPKYLNTGEEILVKSIYGYFFNKERIIINSSIHNSLDRKRLVEVIYNEREGYEYKEIVNISEDMKYIDLDKDISFFKRMIFFKNLSLMLLFVSFFIWLFNQIRRRILGRS